jgi:hypothetical protein
MFRIVLVTSNPFLPDGFWEQDPPLEECDCVNISAPLDPLFEHFILDIGWYDKNLSAKLVDLLIPRLCGL